MAEMANTLAFSAYTQPTLYDSKLEVTSRDRDSGVFLSDNEDHSIPSTPPSRQPSVSLRHTSSVKSTITLSRSDSTLTDRRLRRPAELNLTSSPSSEKPKSELELRYDLIRNSSTRSRAALKSPTQLLKDRLALSPTKGESEKEPRIFTPPRPMLNGCILPGPERQMEGFQGRDVCARTEKGRAAWWCKVDRVVIFDGAEGEGENIKYKTRSSKGLSVARRRGDNEVIVIPLHCTHCQEMLNRQEWKYDVQVCKRGVCWDCKERCRWEVEEEKSLERGDISDENASAEQNRQRADSVLQDEQVRDEELMHKVGIEFGPKSPIGVTGIEERLDEQ